MNFELTLLINISEIKYYFLYVLKRKSKFNNLKSNLIYKFLKQNLLKLIFYSNKLLSC